mgnify:CR=1 FL=1
MKHGKMQEFSFQVMMWRKYLPKRKKLQYGYILESAIIFRVFIGGIADGLLEDEILDRGITCVETFDYDVVDKIYEPYDNLGLNVIFMETEPVNIRFWALWQKL